MSLTWLGRVGVGLKLSAKADRTTALTPFWSRSKSSARRDAGA